MSAAAVMGHNEPRRIAYYNFLYLQQPHIVSVWSVLCSWFTSSIRELLKQNLS